MRRILLLTVATTILITALITGSAVAKDKPNGQPFDALWGEIEGIKEYIGYEEGWVESFFDVVMGRLENLEENVTSLQGTEIVCTTNNSWPLENPGCVSCPEGYELTGCTGGVDVSYFDGTEHFFMFYRTYDGKECCVRTTTEDPIPTFVQATCCKVQVP